METILDQIVRQLVESYAVHTLLLYGSHASGTAGPGSDYDIAAFVAIDKPCRVTDFSNGVYLDAFIYPEVVLGEPTEAYLKLRGSKIVMQRDCQAATFLGRLDEIFNEGPKSLQADEMAARKLWAHKMVTRIERGDAEGNYRRVWLLQALLEDYFAFRNLWFEGPKKALRWLEEFDTATYTAFSNALKPGASNDTIGKLVGLVAGSAGA